MNRGIVNALLPERLAYYTRFLEDYEHIRAEEGRGAKNDEYYLALPHKDQSGRNSRQWEIRACSFDYLLEHVLHKYLHVGGRILDVGAGNCWMSYRLRLEGYSPVSVDLLTNDRDGLGAAEHYRSRLPNLFPRFQAEFARLPFRNEQFDAIVFNASFHYAEDYEATLREAIRCVRSGGLVIISDTPWYTSEASGMEMVIERHATFLQRFGTESNSIKSAEYLTDERLQTLEQKLSVRWTVHAPRYGLRWAMRPLAAKLFNRREPSRFRIYVARKASL